MGSSPLGIVAGGGALPGLVAAGARAKGREVFLVIVEGGARKDVSAFPHTVIEPLDPLKVVECLRERGCEELVIVGSVSWPSPERLSVFRESVASAIDHPVSLSGEGNVEVNTVVVKLLEEFFGFRVRAPDEVVEVLGVPEGLSAGKIPTEENEQDICRAVETLKILGKIDVGQGVVVCRGKVLGVEAQEGTDAMLERVAGLNPHLLGDEQKRSGVLVKLPHPGQDRRMDLPAVGVQTVLCASKARLAGIVVQARGALLASWDDIKQKISQKKMFFKAISL